MASLVAEGDAEARLNMELLGPSRGFGFRPSLSSSDVVAHRSKDSFMADARDASRSNPYMREPKLLTLTQIEKALGKKRFAELFGNPKPDQEIRPDRRQAQCKGAIL